MLRYCSLFSSSSGNCTYVGTATGGLLIDAGVSAKRVVTALEEREIAPESIRALLITHEHSDHVAGLQVLVKRYRWPVLASVGTLDALAAADKLTGDMRLFVVQPGKPVTASDLQILPFSTPHDSRQCLGFRIDGQNNRSLAVVTDMGCVTSEIRQAITGCGLVHIESNHDLTMLRDGPYPYYLKERIRGDGGHLSNVDCSRELPSLLQGGTTRFVLAHLSGHNNTPQLAERTAVESLSSIGAINGRDYIMQVAEPVSTRPVLYF